MLLQLACDRVCPVLCGRALGNYGARLPACSAAIAHGVQSALSMAAEEIGQGRHSTAIVVSVEQEHGTRLLSSVVSVSVSLLLAVEYSDAMLS